jgi:hypothetical protein
MSAIKLLIHPLKYIFMIFFVEGRHLIELETYLRCH